MSWVRYLPVLSPQVDILHPLATLEWSQREPLRADGKLPEDDLHSNCVHLNDKFYVVASDRHHSGNAEVNMLLAFSSDFTECQRLTALPVKGFTLTHYRTQLVLVGGAERQKPFPLTNKLWVSDDGTDWEPSLPPMTVKHRLASAANSGHPEYLIVAGGYVKEKECSCTDIVEV